MKGCGTNVVAAVGLGVDPTQISEQLCKKFFRIVPPRDGRGEHLLTSSSP